MKTILSIVLFLALCASASAQSISPAVVARIMGLPVVPDVVSADYFTFTSTDPTQQTLVQLNQSDPTEGFPAYVGMLYTQQPVNGNQFGAAFRITSNGQLSSNLPSTHRSPGYKVALYAEAASTAGQTSDQWLYGFNVKVEGNSGNNAPIQGLEIDVNNGQNVPTNAVSRPSATSKYSLGLHVASGGINQSNAAIQTFASNTDGIGNKFIRGIIVDSDSYTHRAIEIGKAGGLTSTAGAELAIKHINTRSAILVEADSPSNGNALTVLNSSGSEVASVSVAGEFLSAFGFKITGNAKFYSIAGNGMEFWKDSTPTKAVAAGNKIPGGSLTDDFVVSGYNGSVWSEKFRVYNEFNSISLGALLNVSWGTDAPLGGCASGSLYLRSGNGGEHYLCRNGGWILK